MKKKKIFMGIGGVLFATALIIPLSYTHAQVSNSPNVFTGRDMTIGSTGPDVVMLQGLLIELGYLDVPYGIPLGYYGSLTSGAVARYQQVLKVPNTGYYGPMTKLAMSTVFSSRGWLALLYPSMYN